MTTSNGKSSLKQTQKIQDRKFNMLYQLLTESSERDLLWYYQLGRRVEAIYPSRAGRHYSENAIEQLARKLKQKGVKRYTVVPLATLLWDARRFVGLFKLADVNKLIQQASHFEHPLSWSHVRFSISIKDRGRRAKLLDRSIRDGWSSRRLHQEVKRLNAANEQFSPSGRAPIKPRSGLTDVIDRSEQWLGRCNRIWFRERGSPWHFTEDNLVALSRSERVAIDKLLTKAQNKLTKVLAATQKLADDIKESNAEFRRLSLQGKPKAAPKKRRVSPK